MASCTYIQARVEVTHNDCILRAGIRLVWFQREPTPSLPPAPETNPGGAISIINRQRQASRQEGPGPLDCAVGPAPRCMSDNPPIWPWTHRGLRLWVAVDRRQRMDRRRLSALRQLCKTVAPPFSSSLWARDAGRAGMQGWDGGKRPMLKPTPVVFRISRINRLIATSTVYNIVRLAQEKFR